VSEGFRPHSSASVCKQAAKEHAIGKINAHSVLAFHFSELDNIP